MDPDVQMGISHVPLQFVRAITAKNTSTDGPLVSAFMMVISSVISITYISVDVSRISPPRDSIAALKDLSILILSQPGGVITARYLLIGLKIALTPKNTAQASRKFPIS